MSSHANLTAVIDDRKARLAKLRSLKRKQSEADTAPSDSDATSPKPPEQDVAKLHLSGRNYDTETRGPKLGFEAPPTLTLDKPTLEEQAADIEEESRLQQAVDAQDDKGIDLFKLRPKKPNWDLKRELNQKLEVLNVRTENAIARLVRERLAAKKTAGQRDDPAQVGDSTGLEGAEIIEAMRLREKEVEEEQRRERESEAEEDIS